MTADQLPAEILPAGRLLTAAEFHQLADVPPEVEWFANLSNLSTRRAYETAIRDFMRFTGIPLQRHAAYSIGATSPLQRWLPISTDGP
jgi:hypothetical protein